VVLLGIAEAKVLAANCLPMGFLILWRHIAAEVVGGFHILVVEVGAEVAGFAFATEEVAVGVGWVGGMVVRAEALAFAPVDEGCRWCTRVL
jgi:hypothetical protein